MNGRNDEEWAVFWCALLSPLLVGEVPEDQRGRYLRDLSEQERLLPNGQRKRISVRTLRRQWRRLRLEGVKGVFRRRRKDRGQARRAQAELLARAVELKQEQPYRSDQVINCILKHEFGREVPRSTLYRHLQREGATRRKLGISKEKVRCRWTRDQSNALWVGDFEHGPVAIHQGASGQDPSLGLDRLPQPVHRRRPLLRPREPRHPGGLAAPHLGPARRQPRTVRR